MKLLVVIDMQNDFIDAALGTKEAVAIVPNVQKKISEYKANKNPIVFTRDTHQKDYLKTLEGKNLPVEHCIQGTNGWQISSQLDTSASKIIDKPTFGSFALADYVSSLENLEQIEIVGLCTDICVISNALILKAKLPEVPIVCDSSACAGVTPQSHKNALEAMKMCHIKII